MIGAHPVAADQSPSPGKTGSTASFFLAILGAVLAVIPATAGWGALLCFVALIPALVSLRRVRTGSATNRRLCVSTLLLAPVFFIVALCVAATTAPAPESSPVAAAPTPTPRLPVPSALTAAPPATRAALTPPTPGPAAAASAPAAQAPVGASAPLATAAPTHAPNPALASASAGSTGGTSCDQDTHYINSDGACVPRPTAAAAPPPGATAKCKDGTYSFSTHRQGTCSHHGGVAQWL